MALILPETMPLEAKGPSRPRRSVLGPGKAHRLVTPPSSLRMTMGPEPRQTTSVECDTNNVKLSLEELVSFTRSDLAALQTARGQSERVVALIA